MPCSAICQLADNHGRRNGRRARGFQFQRLTDMMRTKPSAPSVREVHEVLKTPSGEEPLPVLYAMGRG